MSDLNHAGNSLFATPRLAARWLGAMMCMLEWDDEGSLQSAVQADAYHRQPMNR